MARCTSAVGFLFCFIIGSGYSFNDDRIYFDEENMRRWNTPPELIVNGGKHETNLNDNNTPQARFIPFSASFTLNPDANNAHSLSVGGTSDGISLSQSQSSSSGHFGNAKPASSVSQSSSFSAGLSGISASDASAFNLNHPIFGTKSKTNTNSFALGHATSSANGNIINNQAITGAQSSVGSQDHHSLVSSGASSTAGNHQSAANASASGGQGHGNGKPSWTNIHPYHGIENSYNSARRPHVNQKPHQNWYQNTQNKPSYGEWSQNNNENPSLQISTASATSGSSSTSSNGFAFGQSTSQSNWGPNGPTSWTNNQVQTSGNAQSSAQGAAAAVGQNDKGKIQASFSSGAISGSSIGNGYSQGTSLSNNRGENSRGDVTSQSIGISNVQGSANAGSVSLVTFPDNRNDQNIPREFIRNGGERNSYRRRKPKMKLRNPIDEFFTDITDTVVDLFDI
ncbi:hypothetical protein PV328_008957 [Microctonus aethiopoides]|uniref:Uncharacterized protein n=1 Tax=Microctonus aethiopoides TaxID=144406 RepID=A0AA39KRS8_9HYME|nr:hypothetical protein PV328_008957 [Microctonus aethiopoides]